MVPGSNLENLVVTLGGSVSIQELLVQKKKKKED